MGHGGRRVRAGRRPEDPSGQPREHRVTVLLTATEYTALERLARRRGVRLGAAARELVTLGLKNRRS